MQDPINQTGVNLIYQSSDQTNQIGRTPQTRMKKIQGTILTNLKFFRSLHST